MSDSQPEVLIEQWRRHAHEKQTVIREVERCWALRVRVEDVLNDLRLTPALPGCPFPSPTTLETQLDRYLRDLAELTELIAVTDRYYHLVLVKADADEDPAKWYAADVLLHGVQKRWPEALRLL